MALFITLDMEVLISLQLQSIIGSDPLDLSYSEQIINVHAVGFAHLVAYRFHLLDHVGEFTGIVRIGSIARVL